MRGSVSYAELVWLIIIPHGLTLYHRPHHPIWSHCSIIPLPQAHTASLPRAHTASSPTGSHCIIIPTGSHCSIIPMGLYCSIHHHSIDSHCIIISHHPMGSHYIIISHHSIDSHCIIISHHSMESHCIIVSHHPHGLILCSKAPHKFVCERQMRIKEGEVSPNPGMRVGCRRRNEAMSLPCRLALHNVGTQCPVGTPCPVHNSIL